MTWNDIKICKLNTIDSIRATIQVIDLLERILDLKQDKNTTNYKIIHEYLMEAQGSFHAAFDTLVMDSIYHNLS